ncbi:hypothetical protein BABINDRAFT_159044 [Babjeviella inositovora NRRL Y-12698]|uniref:Mid2 domain-containing protein n=1 Tax=Babjeviella inositovora NRRL Y-12698 TaxID=984486 RepID=A0A1E3QXQ4_9ASCO|nr:uncharacterized protein BABINDRAFT_159044 [Babjeviella inositovora NRRL Y-12698]ODQ82455.1 hypothetical protein BABINDRAFT_159044 [Babjeviella inositovora NRRL Y-12698]
MKPMLIYSTIAFVQCIRAAVPEEPHSLVQPDISPRLARHLAVVGLLDRVRGGLGFAPEAKRDLDTYTPIYYSTYDPISNTNTPTYDTTPTAYTPPDTQAYASSFDKFSFSYNVPTYSTVSGLRNKSSIITTPLNFYSETWAPVYPSSYNSPSLESTSSLTLSSSSWSVTSRSSSLSTILPSSLSSESLSEFSSISSPSSSFTTSSFTSSFTTSSFLSSDETTLSSLSEETILSTTSESSMVLSLTETPVTTATKDGSTVIIYRSTTITVQPHHSSTASSMTVSTSPLASAVIDGTNGKGGGGSGASLSGISSKNKVVVGVVVGVGGSLLFGVLALTYFVKRKNKGNAGYYENPGVQF